MNTSPRPLELLSGMRLSVNRVLQAVALYPSYCRPCLTKFLSSCKHERNNYNRKCLQCNSLLYEFFSLHDCAEQARNNPDPWVSLGNCLSTFVTRQECLAPTQSSGDKQPRFELFYVPTEVQHNKNNSTQIEETVEWVRDSGGSKVDEIRCFVLKNSEGRNTFERANTNFDWDVVLGVSVWNRPSQMFQFVNFVVIFHGFDDSKETKQHRTNKKKRFWKRKSFQL